MVLYRPFIILRREGERKKWAMYFRLFVQVCLQRRKVNVVIFGDIASIFLLR